jgi:acyl-CoA dehydrogenase
MTVADAAPWTGFDLPDDLAMLRDQIRRFMREEVRPVEDRQPHDAFELPPADLEPLQEKARRAGFWCMGSPAEYGGGGLSLLAFAVAAEEAARCRWGAYVPACGAFGIEPPSVIWRGSPYQIETYGIPGIAAGKKCFVAISEASGGSDPARAIRTRAVRKGDRYVINGAKMWITFAGLADWGLVFARTGEGQSGGGGITCFIVDQGTPGMTMREIPVIRTYPAYEVHFEDVEVPVEHRLGEEGQGFAICQQWLVRQRVPYAAGVIGVAQEALEMAIDWVKQRQTFRSTLADKQAIQWMIADSEMELRAARLLVWQAAARADAGRDIKFEAGIAKVTATETAWRVVDRCMQMFGALGMAKEMPLERWYRELRIKRVGEGPSEVQRMLVARHILSNGTGS